MPELTTPGPVAENAGIREAACIHTPKIFDSCRDKDCIEDLSLYPTKASQSAIDRAISIKAGKAELLYAYIDVEPVGFNRGFYTVDVRYFYRVTADAFVGASRPVPISGLAVFDKRAILFGSEGAAKVFSSEAVFGGLDEQNLLKSNLPTAVVEAVDPLILNMKLVDSCERHCCDCECCEIPNPIGACFGNDLYFGCDGRRVYLTLGQFSIIRLERDSQLLIPAYDYCIPNKECDSSCGEDDPCEIFRKVQFPMEEFFPPNNVNDSNRVPDKNCGCSCSC